METELLRTFTAVCETGSITRASRILHCSQPAVSRRLALLETLVGAPLFERLPGGMKLSAAGEQLRPHAEAALAAVGDGLEAVRRLHQDDAGPLTVALVGTLAGTWVTVALRELATRHPDVDLRLRTGTSAETVELVRRADATFGLSYAEVADPALASEVLFEETMVVACAPDHPRAGRRVASLTTLRHERWLAFPDRRPNPETSARYVHGVLAAAGVAADAVTAIDSLTAQKRLVESGFAIALMQESAIAEEAATGTLATIPVRQLRVAAPVTLVYRRRGYLSRAATTLLRELRRAARRHGRPAPVSRRRTAGATSRRSVR